LSHCRNNNAINDVAYNDHIKYVLICFEHSFNEYYLTAVQITNIEVFRKKLLKLSKTETYDTYALYGSFNKDELFERIENIMNNRLYHYYFFYNGNNLIEKNQDQINLIGDIPIEF
jgi:hypothetical protein